MTARLAALARSLAALTILMSVLAGPPIALARFVGWPLPRSIPTLDGLDHAARTGISDQLVINTLAVLAWITWAQIAIAITAEITAVARRRPARHLPVLPGIQALAARLVAGALLMTSPLHLTATPVLAMPITATPFAAPDAEPATPVAAASVALPQTQHDPTTASEPRSVIVQRHDSYWAIAERCFNGDGLRWREIRDLNIGRTMPDGTTITSTSDLLRPGWTLHLPATASTASPPAPVVPAAAPQTAPGVEGEIIVEPGDHFWSIAEHQLTEQLGRPPSDSEIVLYWRDLIDANADRLVEPGNPNLIHPGQHLIDPHAEAPTSSEPVPEPAPVPDDPDLPTDVEPPVAPAPTAPLQPSTEQPAHSLPMQSPPVLDRLPTTAPPSEQPVEVDRTSSVLPMVAAAGSISAAVAVGTLRALRRRRRQAALLHPTRTPRPSSDEALHRTLILDADDPALDDLTSVLGRLAVDLAASGARCRPRVVQHHTTHIELLVDHPATAPDGWQADGLLWTYDTRTRQPPRAEVGVQAAPLLVTLGQPDDAGQLYLDLEAEAIVSLTGDPASVHHLVTAILTELALTPLAERISVVTVGDIDVTAAAGLDHITTHATWDTITDDITAWTEQTHHAHVTNDWANTFVARGTAPDHDAVAPLVIIAERPPPDPLLQQVTQQRPASIAIVVAGLVDQATVIECQPDYLAIPKLGLTCTPHPLETATVQAIVDLLDDAAEPSDQTLTVAPDQPTQLHLIDDDETALDHQDASPEVLVRLLGDIHVDAAGERLTAKQTAVIAYIALHNTVTVERLTDAVWAQPSTGSRKRLANTISDCRAVIGHRHLPTAIDGRYSAGPGLQTDTDLFTRLVARAATEPPGDAAATLRTALDLVTGPVFTYRHNDRASFSWVDLENHASIWELKIAAVAQHCAELYLDLRQPGDATATAQHALTIIPTHAGLTETLMRAHAAAGDDHAVRRVYQAHLAALAALDLDDPEDSTTELYDRLRNHSAASA